MKRTLAPVSHESPLTLSVNQQRDGDRAAFNLGTLPRVGRSKQTQLIPA